MRVQLAGETDLAGFRAQARAMLAQGVDPGEVHWSTSEGSDDLFADATTAAANGATTAFKVPASFLQLCESVALHRDPQRFALLYRLLWRLQREPQLRDDPLDGDMYRAKQMARAVGHDIHKMRAFVRFREVAADDGGVLHVAWFEPSHHIVEANAPWFMRRFTQMRWAILTPDRCASWNGSGLEFGRGADKSQAPPADAGEALWLTYYRSIFNPARLKLAMMRKEMPRKYWQNLPEAALISPLTAQALERTGTMVEQPPTQPRRRIVPTAPIREARITKIATLGELKAATQACRDCPIGAMATQSVCGEGAARPALMVVGEQPGDQEDLAGRPFVGPAGQLLGRALERAGISRESLFLTNAVRHFKYEPRGKRRIHKTPAQSEALACAHWLESEIRIVQPGAIVALGATAARSLLLRPVAVTSERGRWHVRADGLRVLVTWHPSALLRMESEARDQAFDTFVHDLALAAAG